MNDEDVPVASGLFDSYRANIVAPDHLLSGLALNILYCFIEVMPTAHFREAVNVALVNALKRNGLVYQRTFFNERKKLSAV